MARTIKSKSKKIGLEPGTLVYTGEKPSGEIKIELINYSESIITEKEIKNVGEGFSFVNQNSITWIDISGLNNIQMIEQIGKKFNFHPLVLEDILSTNQRPKINDYEDYVFIVFRTFDYDGTKKIINGNQISLIFGKNYLISFREVDGKLFEAVESRLRNNKVRIRKSGTDYLAYSLIDTVVDNYFNILEKIGEEIEDVEDKLIGNPQPENLHSIHRLRREMILLRKSVWPLREVINVMERGETALIKKSTGIFLRDLYEHTVQIIDTIESYRDMVSGMLDTYLSSVSNRMNEVMKVLTIIATIFIPITFVAGVFGMNFKHMPELDWYWAYPIGFWAVMIIITGLMIFYFKRKNWF